MVKTGTGGNSVKRLTGRFFPAELKKSRPVRIWRLVILFAILLAVIGTWTNHAVRESLDDAYAEMLKTILEADITALELWISNEQSDVPAIAFPVDSISDFTEILSVARIGHTGETYAFDNRGVLLSESRFTEELRSAGVLDAEVSSILNLQIRDPGGDLLKGYKSDIPMAARPLTKMAASAIKGVDGVDLKGYRNYRGVKVIGAWRWLSQYGIGVATEVESVEAYSVLRPLRLAYGWLFFILIMASAIIAFSAYTIRLLKDRIWNIHRLGQYTLEEKIGEGGMGIVYKARHAMLRRVTALKVLKPESMTDEAVARFEREVQLTSQLTHPNTVEIYDFGLTPRGIFYYVMEYLPGINLSQLMDIEDRIAPGRVIHIMKQVCGSLEEAHVAGLVHRDIKPQNILLCQRGGLSDVVKVLDFGLVKNIRRLDDLEVTIDGALTGTPLYIAPERLSAPEKIEATSDIYSVGAVMFNLLSGKHVFTGSNAMDICTKVMTEDPPRVSEVVDTIIPPELDQLVFDCLARDPSMRPASVAEIQEVLDSVETRHWTKDDARRWWDENYIKVNEMAEFEAVVPTPADKACI